MLFEMLTGKRLFTGETVSDVLAGVLRADADLEALPAPTPPAIRRLLRRCLARDPKNRLHDVADARIVLDETLSGKPEDASEGRAAAPARAGRWTIVAALAVAGLAVAYAVFTSRPAGPSSSPVVRFAVDARTLDFSTSALPFSLSPDGTTLAYVEDEGPTTRLFLRRMDSLDVEPVSGTEGAGAPFV